MIGLVIVSHSYWLAQGVLELARQMGGDEMPMATAGGLDLPDHPIGTDAALILAAIESVYSDDGVIVLMDMGSAILSTETALDMLPEEQRGRVVLSPAPLVEGAITAAVQIRLGQPLEAIVAEMRKALAPKQAQLGDTPPAAEEASASAQAADGQRLCLKVPNALGLHARPAARLVQTVGRFKASVTLRNLTTNSQPVNAASLNNVATLGARFGHELEFTATGEQAAEVLQAIQVLAAQNFGDPVDEAPVVAPAPRAEPERGATAGVLRGLAASSGIAIGQARRLQRPRLTITPQPVEDIEAEVARFYRSVELARADIAVNQRLTAQKTSAHDAMIFEAHALLLQDESLLQPTEEAIRQKQQDAPTAWKAAVDDMVARYRSLDDPLLSARAADVEDVGLRVLGHLLGVDLDLTLSGPGILIAEDLSPSETARLDTSLVQGICTVAGSPTSHSAILARALGIPAVVGMGNALNQLDADALLIVDGTQGEVYVQPSEEVLARYRAQLEQEQQRRADALKRSQQRAQTQDGYRVEVFANIGSVNEVQRAVEQGAEGIGLLRTEFLFLDRLDAPTEDEQYEAFCAIGEALAGRPMVIRTLDVGGDKPLAYVDQPGEANPFLGQRAIRLSLAQPDLFKTQLRAVLRASLRYPLLLMFPMIAIVDEFKQAVTLLEACRAELNIHAPRFPVGMMVEVPSAAIDATSFAPHVDFFSIGTNDLTQYVFAAERGNANVAYLANDNHPVILRLIREVVRAAQQHNKWVGVCGELAGDLNAVEALVGMGVRELSMSASRIPAVKEAVFALSYTQAQQAADRL
ncbi:phosphoenolpyruvate--protein phosphotransferase [Fischerella thermalis CCMEE 5330]|uniref:Phosphocarrier protein HPr n=1 Tax=Fischerella thermalis CCMEE 5330 TaxID=2019670 RepID=A0A2N6MND4_9CYAN|nr:phosphoenolpyruvate--protein phosphotransferase [Fischerella thermalis CCMEE 5330]